MVRVELGRAAHAFRNGRRRFATLLLLAIAVAFGWHAVWGQNGILAYAAKRRENQVLSAQIQKLSDENARLKDHVEHLRSDPDAIEVEARQRLHYTRPGEVIYTLNNAPASR